MPAPSQDLIKQSFPVVFRHKSEIAGRFYELLFARQPGIRALFREDMTTQKEMIASLLCALAQVSFDQDTIPAMLERAVRSHAALGISEQQIRSAQTALSDAVDQTVGPKLTPEVLGAWHGAIRRVGDVMARPPPEP